jgi:flavin-binding protein dodecin
LLAAKGPPTNQGGEYVSSKRVEDHGGFNDQLPRRRQEGLMRANKTLRGITGLHVIEEKASVKNGKIDEYRVTMEITFILEQ